MTEEKVEVWVHKCFYPKCAHVNYFRTDGNSDIICHGCYNYGMRYKGRKMVTLDEWRRSMYPGDYK